jgi:hypothetical protein
MSTVKGPLACGGGALSPLGIAGIDLWREPRSGETPQSNGLILLGPATRATGTRPDVQAVYPNYPDSGSSGWGHLLNTKELANGLYKIHAIAHDLAGKSVDLGVKTIDVENR